MLVASCTKIVCFFAAADSVGLQFAGTSTRPTELVECQTAAALCGCAVLGEASCSIEMFF